MSKPKIGVVLGTTRQNRFSEKAGAWIMEIARAREDLDFEIVDLRDYPMPFFDEPLSPVYTPPKNEAALAWGRKVAELDGYLFITGEYNHSIPAVLKNAIDYAYKEFNKKPAAFIGYGGVGAARAIEHLRQILVEVQIAPMRNGVYIALADYRPLLFGEKTFADLPHLNDIAVQVLDELAWWARTLKAGREGF